MNHDRYVARTEGTCSSALSFRLIDGKVRELAFEGGCSGNLSGIARLVEGMDAREAAERLAGLPCGSNDTSCPDQLARALKAALEGALEASR